MAEKYRLAALLMDGHVLSHPFIVGELACGNLDNRSEILTLLNALPMATQAEHEEVMQFIETHNLMGRGLGFIDMHLLASGSLSEATLWTLDKRLHEVSSELGLAY
jgi:hypothetical protein